jgi:hypothetical protein
VTFEEYTASTGRSPSAGGGHARQYAKAEEVVDNRPRMTRSLLAGKAVAGIVNAVDHEHREV